MAKIHAQVTGGAIKEIEADSVKAAKELMGAATYVATVNGEPSSDDQELSDYDFVALAPAVKGAMEMWKTYSYNIARLFAQ